MQVWQAEFAALRRQLDAVAEAQAAFREEVRGLLAPPAGGVAAPVVRLAAPKVQEPPAAPVAEDCVMPAFAIPRSSDASQATSSLHCGPSQGEVKCMLRDTITFAEKEELWEATHAAQLRSPCTYYWRWLGSLTRDDVEMIVDSVMGFVICANAIFIGFSMDMTDTSVGWLAMDSSFSACFLLELGTKICLKGFWQQYCTGAYGNILDACLVLVDVLQLVLTLSGVGDVGVDLPSASLFRLLRLLKLARVLCILRTDVFSDLLSMIQGMLGGMTTLAWSMVLFLLSIYIISLLFREAFGRGSDETVNPFFDSVPRSMFTTFRCSFGDCSTHGGTPLLEHINSEFGTPATIMCCCFVFIVTIGLFNVISAVFVESTMTAAMSVANAKRHMRLADRRLWCTRITTLIRRLLLVAPGHDIPQTMSDSIEELMALDFPSKVIDELVKDPIAVGALHDLDIDPEDHEHLSEILDPDNSESVGMNEFVDGLRRLRGNPRRSDIVAVDTMVRSIQRRVCDIQTMVRLHVDGKPPEYNSESVHETLSRDSRTIKEL